METLQRLFAFIRKQGCTKARWDDTLTGFIEEDYFDLGECPELDRINTEMMEKFGDRMNKPLWFHVTA